MTFDEWLKDFADNQVAHQESYEIDKDGKIFKLIYKIVFGTLEELRENNGKVLLIIKTNEFLTKEFISSFHCIEFLRNNGITFTEINPQNLGFNFSLK